MIDGWIKLALCKKESSYNFIFYDWWVDQISSLQKRNLNLEGTSSNESEKWIGDDRQTFGFGTEEVRKLT
jgi:hypothetical protein